MTKSIDLIVIGGGAAGLMAAGTAAENGKSVLVFDKNDKLGRKLRITGKGRCNVTNNCDNDTVIKSCVSSGRFLYSALSVLSPQDTMDFFEGLGVPLKTERETEFFRRVITQMMLRMLSRNGARILVSASKRRLFLMFFRRTARLRA